MAKRKLRSGSYQTRSKKARRSSLETTARDHDLDSCLDDNATKCQLLALPVELLDTIIQLLINEPAERRRKLKFFYDRLNCDHPHLFEYDSDYEHTAEDRGICEDDHSMNEILRRPIFRVSKLLRYRAHDYIFRHRAWIRIATKTLSLHSKLHSKVSCLSLCKFAQDHIIPSDLPTFDVFVGGSSPAASADRVFRMSQRSYIFPFFFKSWLEICAALQSIIYEENTGFMLAELRGPRARQLSVRCSRDSPALQKLLDTHILPPFLSLRWLDDISIAGVMLKHVDATSLSRMYTLSSLSSDIEDLKRLSDIAHRLRTNSQKLDSALFVLFADATACQITDRWLGSQFHHHHYGHGDTAEWSSTDATVIKLKKLLCAHNCRAGAVWYSIALTKGMHWLRAQQRIRVSGHNRWCHPDHRILFGLPREDRANLHFVAGLAKRLCAWSIASDKADGLYDFDMEGADEDALFDLKDAVVQMSIAANLQPENTAAHKFYRDLKVEVGKSDVVISELDPQMDDPDGYIEVHDVAGSGFCWAGSQISLQDMGGTHALLPLKELYKSPEEDTTSPRCGKVCNCILI